MWCWIDKSPGAAPDDHVWKQDVVETAALFWMTDQRQTLIFCLQTAGLWTKDSLGSLKCIQIIRHDFQNKRTCTLEDTHLLAMAHKQALTDGLKLFTVLFICCFICKNGMYRRRMTYRPTLHIFGTFLYMLITKPKLVSLEYLVASDYNYLKNKTKNDRISH